MDEIYSHVPHVLLIMCRVCCKTGGEARSTGNVFGLCFLLELVKLACSIEMQILDYYFCFLRKRILVLKFGCDHVLLWRGCSRMEFDPVVFVFD